MPEKSGQWGLSAETLREASGHPQDVLVQAGWPGAFTHGLLSPDAGACLLEEARQRRGKPQGLEEGGWPWAAAAGEPG